MHLFWCLLFECLLLCSFLISPWLLGVICYSTLIFRLLFPTENAFRNLVGHTLNPWMVCQSTLMVTKRSHRLLNLSTYSQCWHSLGHPTNIHKEEFLSENRKLFKPSKVPGILGSWGMPHLAMWGYVVLVPESNGTKADTKETLMFHGSQASWHH